MRDIYSFIESVYRVLSYNNMYKPIKVPDTRNYHSSMAKFGISCQISYRDISIIWRIVPD